ncbi:putative pectin lyase/virulence factor [Helianthus anomalus]
MGRVKDGGKGIAKSFSTIREARLYRSCKNVTIRNLTILAPLFEAPNTDVIDPDSPIVLHGFFIQIKSTDDSSVGKSGSSVKSKKAKSLKKKSKTQEHEDDEL